MVYPGGELAFVSQMVADSGAEPLRSSVHWFTTMVARKASLKALRKTLYSAGVSALRTTEFCQARGCIVWMGGKKKVPLL